MKLIWVFITVGGFIGGYVPLLWGGNAFSAWAIITSTVGALVGIWVYKKLDLE